MKAARIRISDEATQKLRVLYGKTGLTPNLLLRVGFCISLREPEPLNPAAYPEDGQELNRYTLTGEYDGGYLLLLREWMIRHGLTLDNESLVSFFRAHLNRGAMLVARRTKSAADMVLLARAR